MEQHSTTPLTEKEEEEYYMIVKTVQSNTLKTLIEALKDIVNDVNFKFNKNGIELLSIDPCKCAIVNLILLAKHFELFKCGEPGSNNEGFSIGVNIKSMFTLLKTVGNNDVITMYMKNRHDNRLHIIIENREKNMKDVSCLKLLDFDEAELTIENISYDSVIEMPSSDFQKHIKDLYNISDTVTVESHGDIFKLSVSGDIGDKSIIVQQDKYNDDVKFEQKSDVPVCERYALKYLSTFVRSSNLCINVSIFTKQNNPIIIKYLVGSLGNLKFILSPYNEDQ